MAKKIQDVSINDINYPSVLKKIANAPKTLYYKGELPKEKEICFAVVGSRLCSPRGEQTASDISGKLAEAGITIVSGLAPGIDTASHWAAVERGKKTVAVLGAGLDEKSIYPQENLKLAERILENGGCLISEYPAGTRGSKFTFPERNRIISGLSLGVLVIEAEMKSGSLITANFAKKQGRKLFVLSGLNSQGCDYLIKNEAELVKSANDIINKLK